MKHLHLNLVIVLALIGITFMTGCTKKTDKKTFWIYTSLYKDTISEMDEILSKQFPTVDFQWYQAGSENVAARLNAELNSGNALADLIMTSDPFWYLELKKHGHLLNYKSSLAQTIPAEFKDPEGAFTIVRIPTVVMAYNKEALTEKETPKSFKELLDPKWKGKVSMGSPMQSGTSFSAAAQLVRKYGWEYFTKMRANDILSAGGNSAVIGRMETKERPVGIVLLENVLASKKRGSPVEAIYPTDGAIMVPSPMAIIKQTEYPEIAKKVYDAFLGKELQLATIRSRMYSPYAQYPAPEGAKPFKEVRSNAFEWGPAMMQDLYLKREGIKKKFVEVVLN